jgi:fructose-1,6-bisphosphatase/inositol monophosphatase family enzyme
VSIAYERCGRLELAVVFDALKRELFVAARGRGTRLNAPPIQVSATPSTARCWRPAFPRPARTARLLFHLLGGLHDAHAGSAAHGIPRVISGRSGRDADRSRGGGRVNNLDGSALPRRAQDPREQSQAA